MYRKILSAYFIGMIGVMSLSPPLQVFAMGKAADLMCKEPWDYSCPCGSTSCPSHLRGGQGCPCSDTTLGFVTKGTCISELKCQAASTNGMLLGSLGTVLVTSVLGALITKMLQPSPSASSASSPTGSTSGCAQYYQTTDPNNTDPCAYYVPVASSSTSNSLTSLDTLSSSSTSDLLLSSLGAYTSNSSDTAATSISDIINQSQNTNAATSGGSVTAYLATSSIVLNNNLSQAAGSPTTNTTQGGVKGNIEVTNKGGTIYANSEDIQSNTAVAGFYGSDTFGNASSTSFVARMCISRPWSGSFLSKIIPETFFDGLCRWAGFQVGTVSAPQEPVVQFSVEAVHRSASATTSTLLAKPKIQIWAVPASVPLDTRTSIFWNAQGTSHCNITASDGNFNETATSGSASTVPLTEATTFTIVCLTLDGVTSTASTVVNLSF